MSKDSNVVDFRSPALPNVKKVKKFNSLKSVQNYISAADAVRSGSAAKFTAKKQGWIEADPEVAIQNSYQHLLKFWDEHPELKSMKIVEKQSNTHEDR